MSGTRAGELAAYRRASGRLLGLIRGDGGESRSPRERRHRAEAKLARTARLLALLDNPHERYPIVHVTGTSGKGSTAAAIAASLSAAGYRVGLRTSPYLQVMTEKLQIGPALIDAPSFARLTDRVLRLAEERLPFRLSGPHIGYAETWAAISLLWFAERNVDVAVVEVGAGGRFDATNVLTPAVSVITSVGLDHIVSLGPSLADIAWHKAGIIKSGAPVVVGDLPPEADAIVSAHAAAAGSEIFRVEADRPPLSPDAPPFARTNAGIALAAIDALRERGFKAPPAAVRTGLHARWLPARLERMPGDAAPSVWIDSAHNADKMAALMCAWAAMTTENRPPVTVIGMLRSKDISAIVSEITIDAAGFVATAPRVHGKRSLSAAELAAAFAAAGRSEAILVEPEPENAIGRAIEIAASIGTSVLVAGSLYLAGEIRRHWYPDDEIILQRTPWPIVGKRQGLPLRSVAR